MKSFHVKAVLFDFDGTLTQPGALNFTKMRETIGCPQDMAILEFIDAIEDVDERRWIVSLLEDFEMKGAEKSTPCDGACELIRYIQSQKLGIGILTRNGLNPVLRSLEKFPGINEDDFDIIVTRNDSVKPKPSPHGVCLAAERMGVHPSEMIMVGDYIFDIRAGNRAGSITIFLKNPGVIQRALPKADFTVSHLKEVSDIIRLGL